MRVIGLDLVVGNRASAARRFRLEIDRHIGANDDHHGIDESFNTGGVPISSILWPRFSHDRAASRSAVSHSLSRSAPYMLVVIRPIRASVDRGRHHRQTALSVETANRIARLGAAAGIEDRGAVAHRSSERMQDRQPPHPSPPGDMETRLVTV